jgi:hypothetical protein
MAHHHLLHRHPALDCSGSDIRKITYPRASKAGLDHRTMLVAAL